MNRLKYEVPKELKRNFKSNKISDKKLVITPTSLFYFAYAIWLIASIIFKVSMFSQILPYIIYTFIRIIALSILIIRELWIKKYSRIEFLGIAIIGLLFIIAIRSDTMILIDTILFIFCARNVPFEKIIKLTFFIQAFLMIFIAGSSFAGIIENRTYVRSNGQMRWSIGYTYTTFPSQLCFYMTLMYIYIKKESIKIWNVIFLILINSFLYILTDTKNPFYLVILFSIMAYMFKFSKQRMKNNIATRILFEYCIPAAALIMILASMYYDPSNELHLFINTLLSKRLTLGNRAVLQYGFSILGQPIQWIGNTIEYSNISAVYNYVDSSYLQIALNQGVILLILICVGFVLIGRKAITTGNKYLCLIILAISIHSAFDPQLFNLCYNPFILALGYIFNKNFIKGENCVKKYNKKLFI